MKKKGLILLLILVFSLFLIGISSKNNVSAANVGEWELVTDAATLKANDIVLIVHKSSGYGLGEISTTSTKYGIRQQVTLSSDKNVVINKESAKEFTILSGSSTGTYAFKTEDSKYLYWSSGNSLTTNSTLNSNASWLITISDGEATIKNGKDNSRILQYNKSSGQERFACYATSQQKVSIYKKVTEVELDKPSFTLGNRPTGALLVGTTHTLTVENIKGCLESDISWASANVKVATISNGVVTAVGVGGTVITASVDGEPIASCTLSVYSHDNDLNNLVKSYYGEGDNEGKYTKKTEIHLTQAAWNSFKGVIHKNATLNRTTYYGENHLLMGDFDGGFDEINSGYMNKEDGHMYHFEYSQNPNSPEKNVYKSVSDIDIESYYVTLKDMIDADFFNGWKLVNGSYRYKIIDSNAAELNPLVHDFLWFTAPGLSDAAFSSTNGLGHFISQTGLTLIVEEKIGGPYGDYLSLRVVLDALDAGKVRTPEQLATWEPDKTTGAYIVPSDEELTLAEARVYKGYARFDENQDINELYVEEALKQLGSKYNSNDNMYQNLTNDLTLDGLYTVELFGKVKDVKISWNGEGVVNNVLLYSNPATDNPIDLTATLTCGDITEYFTFNVLQLQYVEPAEADVLAEFGFGDNIVTSEHKDNNTANTSYKETVNGYTFAISSASKVYDKCYDADGDACLKLGTSSAIGKFSFTVTDDVTKVVIYVAGYKANSVNIKINGTTYNISTTSNSGVYTPIEIDTRNVKTITFETTSSPDERCMIDKIQYWG